MQPAISRALVSGGWACFFFTRRRSGSFLIWRCCITSPISHLLQRRLISDILLQSAGGASAARPTILLTRLLQMVISASTRCRQRWKLVPHLVVHRVRAAQILVRESADWTPITSLFHSNHWPWSPSIPSPLKTKKFSHFQTSSCRPQAEFLNVVANELRPIRSIKCDVSRVIISCSLPHRHTVVIWGATKSFYWPQFFPLKLNSCPSFRREMPLWSHILRPLLDVVRTAA